MRKRILWTVSTLLVLAAALGMTNRTASAATQAAFYVNSISGDDRNNGTSISTSFKSLEQARQAVSQINQNMTGDIYVYLRGGIHTLDQTLTFGSKDSGTNGYKIYYKNYGTETPVISGGTDLTAGWSPDAGTNLYKRYVGDLNFRQLYAAGTIATTARTPNKTDVNTMGPYYRTTGADIAAKQYLIPQENIAAWNRLSSVEMVVQPHWYHNRLRLLSFTKDSSTAAVAFQAPESAYAFMMSAPNYAGNAYHLENALELLDTEGEWYLNTDTKTLYYKPKTGEVMNTASITAGNLETLISITGTPDKKVHDLEFQGLAFQYTDWTSPTAKGLVATQGVQNRNTSDRIDGAIQVAYASNIRFTRNTFRYLGGDGLQLVRGVDHSQIVNNKFLYIAANAINLDTLVQKNATGAEQTQALLIGNNTISRIGQSYTNGMGIMASYISDSIIEHNEISYGPYTGIQVGNQPGGFMDVAAYNNKIRYNNLHHLLQLHDDGGAVYTLARQRGTQIYENWIHHIQKSEWAMGNPVVGIYLDNCSEFIEIQHNVLQQNTKNTYEQTFGYGTQNNIWLNNDTQDQSVTVNAGITSDYEESAIQ